MRKAEGASRIVQASALSRVEEEFPGRRKRDRCDWDVLYLPGSGWPRGLPTTIVAGEDKVTEVPGNGGTRIRILTRMGLPGDDASSGEAPGAGPVRPDVVRNSPESLAAIEPVQLLSLLVSRRALEHAGYGTRAFNRERTSDFRCGSRHGFGGWIRLSSHVPAA